MLTKELHNERFAVDLPVYHLLSRHNISFGLTDGGIVTGLSFLCQLLFTGVLLRPPFISLPLPFRSNGALWAFASSYRPSRLANPRSATGPGLPYSD